MPQPSTWQASWPADPIEASRRLGERYPHSDPSGLVARAAWTVEGLHYLADVDAALSAPPHGHNHEALDLAHARWATVDAVTAIDLCAAALGRMHRGYPRPNGREMDFGIARQDGALLGLAGPGEWIAALRADAEYERVWKLWDTLVHRTARRRIEVRRSSSWCRSAGIWPCATWRPSWPQSRNCEMSGVQTAFDRRASGTSMEEGVSA